MTSNHALRTVALLRRLSVGEETPSDRAWLSACLGRYLAEAPDGLRLEEAFGLAAPGRNPWWRSEARQERDEALREMVHRFCDEATVSAQAAWLQALARRYEATAWRHDRAAETMPPDYAGRPKAWLFRAFRAGPVPTGLRQLRSILQGEDGDDAGNEPP